MLPEILAALKERGHRLHLVEAMGVSQAIVRSADGKEFIGAADRRAGGKA